MNRNEQAPGKPQGDDVFASLRAAAVIFDLDGVLVDSASLIQRHWSRWAAAHDLDAAEVIAALPGRRARDVVRRLAPDLDAAREASRLEQAELQDPGVCALPGAARLLSLLPPDRWAVVTSATRALAFARLDAAGLPRPRVLIAGDGVTRGKPDPEGLLAAARALRVVPGHCLVVEDSGAGVAAACAAGMEVIAVGAGATLSRCAGFCASGIEQLVVRVIGKWLTVQVATSCPRAPPPAGAI